MCESGVVPFCGDGNGASEGGWEVLIRCQWSGRQSQDFPNKNSVRLAKPKIS